MDDEIDIEEHDILEHPQVKAVFPDLSKIQIQVHTGASFLEETSAHTEEFESLLEERQDYVENDFEEEFQDIDSKLTDDDLSNTAQVYAGDLTEDNLEEEFLEETLFENEVLEEAHKILEKECNNVVSQTDTEIIVKRKLAKKVQVTENNLVDEIQEISDDEFLDNVQHCAANNTEEIALAEFDNEANRTANSSISKEEIFKELNFVAELVENILEISDDEESRDIKGAENDDVNGKVLKNDNEFSGVAIENVTDFKKTLENDADFEGILDNDVDIEKEQANRAYFKETFANQEYEANESVKDIPEQNELNETVPQYSEQVTNVHEYPQVPIKQEIFDVPIKQEIDNDYEMDSNTNFDETLPDETFVRNESPPIDHHFNNKIILGSKPSSRIESSSLVVPSRNFSILVVLLEDWGVHLKNSHSFCEECKILFTTPNALDAHRMVAHSLLAPITNRAVKSTAKSNKSTTELKNIAKKSTGSVANKEISNSTYCNHCNVTFKDHTALIKHLYELLPAKNYSCNFCTESFKTQNDLLNHNSLHVKIEPRRILKAKKNSDKNPMLRNLLNKEQTQIYASAKAVKRTYPKSEIQSHSETVKSQPVEIKRELSSYYINKWLSRYKCMVCNQILHSYAQARKHRGSHSETQSSGKRSMIMFKRLKPKKESPNNSKDKIKYEEDSKSDIKNEKSGQKQLGKEKNDDKAFNLIAKSALFQCSKCNVHFASCTAGTAHFTKKQCGSQPTWSCSTCKKKLRKRDANYHRKQHEISKKLKIYKITKNTNERTLCKCLKCGVHFDYILLKMHINKCGKIPTVKCKRCNILLARHKLTEHNVKHETLKMKPADFIFVDYAVVKEITKSKPKLTSQTSKNKIIDKKPVKKAISRPIKVKAEITVKKEPVSAKKRLKIISKLTFEQEKVTLYYCKHCKIYLYRSSNIARTIKNHFAKKCSVKRKFTFFCEQCGLHLPLPCRENHLAMHNEKGLSLKSFDFYDFQTLKPIIPPIPEYPCCKKCKIHFLHHNTIKDHICGEDYDNCEYCGDKFEFTALKVHKPFHKLQPQNHKIAQKTISPTKIIPELMKKYESMNAIWNILFVCGKCDLVTDLYNKAVEHSQAHLKKEQSQPNTIKCYICNLKFDESCWSKHSELHARMKINRKDFKVLKYAPNQLLNESWFQMFETLPEKEIRQIIDRSVFGSERSLKMRLIKDGLPEFTVYCCSSCEVSYDNNSILDHVKSKCKVSKHICKTCDIAFDAANTLNFHELLHQKGIKKEEFRIVHFVKLSKDIDTNSLNVKKVKTVAKKCVVKSKKLDFDRKKRVIKKSGASLFVLYKCMVCSACVNLKISTGYHVCTPVHHLTFCKICKQNFSFRKMGTHKAKHLQQPQFRAKNIKVIGFEPTPGGRGKKLNNPPKTKHRDDSAASSKTAIKKLDVSDCSENDPTSLHSEIELTSSSSSKSKIARSNYKIRSSVDTFESFANKITDEKATTSKGHKTIITSKLSQSLQSVANSDTDLEEEDVKTVKIYKCDCGLHYTSLKTIQAHIQTCNNDDRISKENCSRCRLLFPTDILVSHLCKHHSQDTILSIENVPKKSNKVEATSTQGNKSKISASKDYVKLYKCSDCNVYFLNQNSCYKHTSKHQALDPKQYIECKMCCFQFRILSLHIHMKKHHEKEFNLERVLVEEYYPSVGKKAPKIDIYFASERFQNVQVSSSND